MQEMRLNEHGISGKPAISGKPVNEHGISGKPAISGKPVNFFIVTLKLGRLTNTALTDSLTPAHKPGTPP
jgi:hypothetical protein